MTQSVRTTVLVGTVLLLCGGSEFNPDGSGGYASKLTPSNEAFLWQLKSGLEREHGLTNTQIAPQLFVGRGTLNGQMVSFVVNSDSLAITIVKHDLDGVLN